MLSGYTIWCVLMITAIAVTTVVAKPSTDAAPSGGGSEKSTNEGGNTSEDKEMPGEPSSDQDIDECLTSKNTICPDPHTECMKTGGTYTCPCVEGYVNFEDELCQDLDECCTFDNLCLDPRTECINTEGSYTCGCKEGYVKLEGGFCHDVDECKAENSTCPDPNTECVNYEGSYTCPCKKGYIKLEEETCQDLDECGASNNVCLDPRTVCVNTEGSYTCDCTEGYVKVEGGYCEDIDECLSGNNTCPDPVADCVNTEGSYTCDCKEGFFKLERGTCQDIDECRVSSDVCSNPGTECVNTEGSYTCTCMEGYVKQEEEELCTDIDECHTHKACSDPHTNCINTVGSYTCLCLEGYFLLDGTCQEQYSSNCSHRPKDPPRVIVQLAGGPEVMCDTLTDGGGWLVFQRRTSGAVDFFRDWLEYKHGFGDRYGNFWLGNQRIHQITSKRPYELRVDLQYKGKSYFAQYDSFSIESEQKNYTLRLGAFSSKSNTTDDLSYNNGEGFSTFDRDNDSSGGNCAVSYHGAWWYGNCAFSNLNGHWGNKTNSIGPYWVHLTTYDDVVTFSEMKIRPIDQD